MSKTTTVLLLTLALSSFLSNPALAQDSRPTAADSAQVNTIIVHVDGMS